MPRKKALARDGFSHHPLRSTKTASRPDAALDVGRWTSGQVSHCALDSSRKLGASPWAVPFNARPQRFPANANLLKRQVAILQILLLPRTRFFPNQRLTIRSPGIAGKTSSRRCAVRIRSDQIPHIPLHRLKQPFPDAVAGRIAKQRPRLVDTSKRVTHISVTEITIAGLERY